MRSVSDRERLRRLVARLHLERGPVDGAAVEPRRRAGLEPAERKAEPLQRARKPERRRLADPAGRRLLLADMDQPAQERAGGQHHGAAASSRPSASAHAGDAAVADQTDRRPRLRSTVRFAVSRIAACIAAA